MVAQRLPDVVLERCVDLTDLFGLLSDKTRLSILMLLCEGEKNVSGLCQELHLPQPTVSHHLGLLRIHNLIDNRRSGKQVFYGLNGRIRCEGPMNLTIQAENFRVSLRQPHNNALGSTAAFGENGVPHAGLWPALCPFMSLFIGGSYFKPLAFAADAAAADRHPKAPRARKRTAREQSR